VLLKRKIVIQAVFAGKIASAVMSFGVMAAFFHPILCKFWSFNVLGYVASFDWIATAVGCVLSIYALITYFIMMLNALKQFNIDLAAGKVDKFGNRLDASDKEVKH
ncbi:MAG: hypothetical protein RSB08_04285, partial [Clostridia bacterium]